MSVRIGLISTPPAVTLCALEKSCLNRGYAFDAASIICTMLHLNCSFSWFNGTEYGDADENGTATGLIDAIQRGEFDASVPYLSPTFRRAKAVSFSQSYFDMDIVLVTRANQRRLGAEVSWSLFYAFQWPVMLTFAASLGIMTSIIILARLVFDKPVDSLSIRLSEAIMPIGKNTGALLSAHYDRSILQHPAIKILIAIWGLAVIVLARAYTGILFSRKIYNSNSDLPYKDFITLIQCLEENRCKLIMPSLTHSYYLQLTAPGSIISDRVNKAFEYNPVIIMPQEKIPQAILKETQVYLVWLWNKQGALYDTNGNEDCSYYIVNTPMKKESAFAVRKGASMLLRDLSSAALAFQETGLSQELMRKYEGGKMCEEDEEDVYSSIEDGNGIYGMRTIFYLYCMGSACAVVVFCAEVAVGMRGYKGSGDRRKLSFWKI